MSDIALDFADPTRKSREKISSQTLYSFRVRQQPNIGNKLRIQHVRKVIKAVQNSVNVWKKKSDQMVFE